MAMLISLSHRDEREITVLPPNPIGAFGVNRKTQPLPSRSLGCGPLANDGPLAGASQSHRGPVHRTGAGRRRRRRQECRRPNAGNPAPAGARQQGARDRVRQS
nr:hypothetical protein [Novosphingobium sp. KA1]